MSLGDGSLDMPYEDDPLAGTPGMAEQSLEDMVIASGVVTLAASLPNVGEALQTIGFKPNHPVVIFRFALPHGEFHKPIALVVTENQLRDLKTLVGRTVDGALNQARRARKRGTE
jgi:hypothetical protein